MTREPIDLSALARFIADDLRRGMPERSALFRVQPGLRAEAEPTLLRAVVATLLGAAWKATERRRPALIEFGADCADGKPVFFVKDNGHGLDHGMLRTSFVECLLERHGGRLWWQAQKGLGATLYFTL